MRIRVDILIHNRRKVVNDFLTLPEAIAAAEERQHLSPRIYPHQKSPQPLSFYQRLFPEYCKKEEGAL